MTPREKKLKPIVCEHGSLKRQCNRCEMRAEIEGMKSLLRECREWVDWIDYESHHMPPEYHDFLRRLDEALK